MVLRLTSCSSRRSGFFVTVTPEKPASHELDASVEASEPHDFAVRFRRPRLKRPASCPASVTISSRPSVGQDGRNYKLIWVFGKSEYFCEGGWTEESINCPSDLPVGSLKAPDTPCACRDCPCCANALSASLRAKRSNPCRNEGSVACFVVALLAKTEEELQPQIRLAYVGIALDVARRALHQHAAGLQDVGAVGDVQAFGHALLDDQHR